MKLQPMAYSERMGARIKVLADTGETIAHLEVRVLRQGSLTVKEMAETVVREVVAPDPLFRQACERILDMVRQDDGEAFFEGEKFLKQHAPDLYNRIGLKLEEPRGEG